MRYLPVGRNLAAIIALSSLGLVTACAPTGDTGSVTAQTSDSSCFRPSQVNGFNAVDEDTVNVHVGPSQVYQLELFGYCTDIDWAQRIGIRSTSGSSWVCQGLDAEIIAPGPTGGQQRCRVSSIRRLSDEEARDYRGARE